jgi:hypothetical protein
LFDFFGHGTGMYGTALPVTPSERLAAIVAGLLNAVGKHSRFGLLWVIGGLVGRRIMKARKEALELIARIEKGTLRRPSVRREEAAARKPMDEATRQRLVEQAEKWRKMPRKPGWLVALVGYEAAGFGSQLSHLLQDEEMKRHLAATPRLGKALWPVCRMLGIDRALLGLSPVERKRRRTAREDREAGNDGDPPRRRRRQCAEGHEPSRAVIMREINTRRWPSIEMQARPDRYRWFPEEGAGPEERQKESG